MVALEEFVVRVFSEGKVTTPKHLRALLGLRKVIVFVWVIFMVEFAGFQLGFEF